jgi:hypothetical protein
MPRPQAQQWRFAQARQLNCSTAAQEQNAEDKSVRFHELQTGQYEHRIKENRLPFPIQNSTISYSHLITK